MKKTQRAFGLFLLWLVFAGQSAFVWSQPGTETQQPVFTCDESVHDFGKIRETEGYAVHEFVVKNGGTAPLVISRVLTTCGCAQPEWSTRPIEPGKEGFVIVSYDMKNRPGPFSKNITVFTNERTLRHVLTIKGDVIPRPEVLNVLFHDTIGTVQLEQTRFLFSAVLPREKQVIDMWIQNFGKEVLNLTIEDVPDFLTVTAPPRLDSNFPEKMMVEIDVPKADENKRGRQTGTFSWKTVSGSGETITRAMPVSVNFIDDFSKMTPAEKADGATAQISTASLHFGRLKNKRVNKELLISNNGKSTLNIHSITVDDATVTQITGFKKQALRPGETLKLRVYVNPTEVTGSYYTNLFVVSNDPQNPVQEVEIAFEK
ncbi:MAG: DUF1573 domain-containing protein [Tannerella sp.]|jgi:hypothetical protein|nr:DUF1573 domain-containing protein [Tannerella sp.]